MSPCTSLNNSLEKSLVYLSRHSENPKFSRRNLSISMIRCEVTINRVTGEEVVKQRGGWTKQAMNRTNMWFENIGREEGHKVHSFLQKQKQFSS